MTATEDVGIIESSQVEAESIVQQSHSMLSDFSNMSCKGGKTLEANKSEDKGITLVEFEKTYPVRDVQHSVSLVEDLSEHQLASTTLTQTQTTVNVATIHGCLESPHLKPPPEIMVAPEAAKTCQSGHSDVDFHENNELTHTDFHCLDLSSERTSALPVLLTSQSLGNLQFILPEKSSSFNDTIHPSPSNAFNHVDQTPSIPPAYTSPLLSSSPSTNASQDPGTKLKDFHLQPYSNQNLKLSDEGSESSLQCHQIQSSVGSLSDSISYNIWERTTPKHGSDSLQKDKNGQYDDVTPLNEVAIVELTKSKCSLQCDLVIPTPEDSQLHCFLVSDIDSDDSMGSNHIALQNRAFVKNTSLLKEQLNQHEGIMEEVEPNLAYDGEYKDCSRKKVHELFNFANSSTRIETLMAETVLVDSLQSLEEHAGLSSSLPPKPAVGGDQEIVSKMREYENFSVSRKTRLRRELQSGETTQNISPVVRSTPRINVIGTWYTCAGCNQQLGTSDLMIIEQLSLFYHLSCFVCARCGIQLSDGKNETSVRIRNGLIYCYICYHRLSKSQSRSREKLEGSRLKTSPVHNERHSSLARSPAKEDTLNHTCASYQSNGFKNSLRR